MESLQEDILIKIFKRLPFKSIHSCRWVSKPWMDLISTRILPQPLPAADPRCILCEYGKGAAFLRDGDGDGAGKIDIGMSFLPLDKWERDELTVLDCSNGLVLCRTGSWGKHYVCNPLTKSRALLPPQDKELTDGWHCTLSYLGFKPWASPHYSVLSVQNGGKVWSMYSSRTGKWSKPRRLGGEHVWACCRDQGEALTMWHGDAYVVRRRPVEVDAFMKVRVETARYRLAEGKEEEIGFPEMAEKLIVFPDSKIQPDTCIGRLGDEVCLTILTGLGLTVWRLDGTEWALKHASNVEALLGVDVEPREYMWMHMPCTLAFWRHNSVFLFYHGAVYLYDLDTMTLEQARPFVRHYRVQLFPFSPCKFEVFVRRRHKMAKPMG